VDFSRIRLFHGKKLKSSFVFIKWIDYNVVQLRPLTGARVFGGAGLERGLRACLKSGILALQTPKFYLAGSKRARKSGFLRSRPQKTTI
jgi:hypothetical protein